MGCLDVWFVMAVYTGERGVQLCNARVQQRARYEAYLGFQRYMREDFPNQAFHVQPR